MPVQTKTVLKTYFETGDFPTEQQFADLIDSFQHIDDALGVTDVTLDAAGETSMDVSYSGGSVPVLTKTGAGQFLLTIPTGVRILNFTWEGNEDNLTPSFELQLTIRDTDDRYVHGIVQTFAQSNGTQFGKSDTIVHNQDQPIVGDVEYGWTNMNLFGTSGWRVVAQTR